MTVSLEHGKPASEDAIRKAEKGLGIEISMPFRRFLARQNGAKPENNSFRFSKTGSCRVNRFIPVAKIAAERENIENIPRSAYPIAWAEGGNYIFIDEGKKGAVYFWDHELPDNVARLAPQFDEFLDGLEPHRPAPVDPSRLKSIRVNYELMARRKAQSQKSDDDE